MDYKVNQGKPTQHWNDGEIEQGFYRYFVFRMDGHV